MMRFLRFHDLFLQTMLKYIRRNLAESLHIGASIDLKMCRNRDYDPILGEFINCV